MKALHQNLQRYGVIDPLPELQSMAATFDFFVVVGVEVLIHFGNGLAWVGAAASCDHAQKKRAEAVLFEVEKMALENGCDRVGFQTVRRGLCRVAERLGYKSSDGKTWVKKLCAA